jgi:ribose/xylose/arabinose/galactoside ABC-type transport system permease subunit
MESTIASSNPPSRKSGLGALPGLQELGLVIVILGIGVVLTISGYINTPPGHANIFLNLDNLIDQIATPMSYYAIMAVGATVVIVSGGIDISVGSIMALSALASAFILQYMAADASAWKVLPIALLVGPIVGLICGVINGILIVGLRIHPFIITLGTLSIYRGLAIVSHKEATLPTSGRHLPLAYTDHFMQLRFGGEKLMPMIIMLTVAGVGAFFLSKTVGGREIYALGGNEEAARFSGLRINRIKLAVYTISGVCAGIAGMVSLGRYGAASSNTASGYELTVVAAAVVGGASLSGGRGTALGALLGALIIAMIEDSISKLHWNSEYRLIIVGAAIILAAAVDRLSESVRQRRLGQTKRN